MATGIFFCLSLIPTAISTAVTPKPLDEVSLDLRASTTNSPVAFVGCLLVGVANGAWGTLGAVYGARIGISTTEIALMMSLTVIAGAVMQLPVGRLSDRTDRRFVLAARRARRGAASALVIFFVAPRNGTVVLVDDRRLRRARLYALFDRGRARQRPRRRPRISSRFPAACCCSTASAR